MQYSVLPYYFEKNEDYVIISNMFRDFLLLKKDEFKDFIEGKLQKDSELFNLLKEKRFIHDNSNFNNIIDDYAKIYLETKTNLLESTYLHIFVVTLECNLNCLYCQADKGINENLRCMMDIKTAEAAVNIAMQSPRKKLTFEFQGGEPLLNFEVIKFIVDYANKKKESKEISFTIVTNCQAMDEDKANYLINNKIGICISLDGPQDVHDFNRPSKNRESNYEKVIYWINYFNNKGVKVGLLPTTTKASLNKYKEIVDLYINLGARTISIRELSPFGRCKQNWDKIGYTAEEFVDFYIKTLHYILQKNKEGIPFKESYTEMYLRLILTKESLRFPDFKSPCGAVIGQIAYNWNGDIYTCDEGRMIANKGDQTFKIGNAFESSYKDCLNSDVTKCVISSSCIECNPTCSCCVYNPICGICPVYNYVQDGSFVGKVSKSQRCKILKGILRHLIYLLNTDNENSSILRSWINND
ncbi:His-Xaa-Ser system radical SAM maturase HxsB [Thermoanaerobacterium sp. R66]|uniref:His-Xaa-Ser system radical SAM maturase HxsB n=1 Tax=Thermoanaerobacterium sp. R66 TaxID=2742479 RepID=UPI00237FE8ED|nr:His-Xaa-Ser system radical SAM maturase HxsB [Thermoanaerobacterium sp. R66]MDE4543213.1 His-Xaa-Ser system radical SAM maturase HxsB [Thermoanaerobacterium sp. R66]